MPMLPAATIRGTIGKRPSFGRAVAPADSTILYTQFDLESSELMLIENFRWLPVP